MVRSAWDWAAAMTASAWARRLSDSSRADSRSERARWAVWARAVWISWRRDAHPRRELAVGLLAHPADLGLALVEDPAHGVLAPLEVVLGLRHDLAGLGVGPVDPLLGVGPRLLEQRSRLGGRLLLVDGRGAHGALGLDLRVLAELRRRRGGLLEQGGAGGLLLLVALGEVGVHLLDTCSEGGVALGLVRGIPLPWRRRSRSGQLARRRLGPGAGVVDAGPRPRRARR